MDEISHFNVSKKVAQLNKVIEYLLFHLNERENHIIFLENRYKIGINKCVQDYSIKISALKDSMINGSDKIQKSVDSMFQEKHRNLSMVHKSSLIDFHKKIDVENTKYQDILNKILNGIREVMALLSTGINSVNTIFPNAGTDLVSNINKIKLEFKKSISLHDESSSKKISDYKTRSTSQISGIEEGYKEQLNQIKSQVQGEKPLIPEEVVLKTKESLQSNSLELKSMKESLRRFYDDFNNIIRSYRIKMTQKINELSNSRDTNSKEIHSLKKIETDQDETHNSQNHDIEEKKKIVNSQYCELLNEANSGLKELKNKNREKIKEESLKSKSILQLNLKSYEQTKSEIESEFEDLSLLNERISRQINERIESLKEYIIQLKENYQYEIEGLKNDHITLKEKNHQSLRIESDQHQDLVLFNIDNHTKRMKLAMESIKQSNELAEICFQKSIEKKQLTAINETNNSRYLVNLENSNSKNNDLVQKLQNGYDLANSTNMSTNEIQYSSFIGDCNEKIKERSQYHEGIEKQLEQRGIAKIDEALSGIMSDWDTRSDIMSINVEMQNKLLQMEREYNLVSIITQNNDQKFINVEKELKNKLRELPQKIENEKKTIFDTFQTQYSQFEKMHNMKTKKIKSQKMNFKDVRSNIISMYKQSIDELDCRIFDLQKTLDETVHNTTINESFVLESDSDIAKIVSELNELRKESSLLIREKENEYNEAKNQLLKELEVLKQKINENKDKEREINDLELSQIHEQIDIERGSRKSRQQAYEEREAEFASRCENRVNLQKNNNTNEASSLINEASYMTLLKENIQIDFEQNKEQIMKDYQQKEISLKLNALREIESLKTSLEEFKQSVDFLVSEKVNRNKLLQEKLFNRPMRKEEESLMYHLESILAQKTQYISIIGRELLEYRDLLISQEGMVNSRFGNDPSISIMKKSSTITRPYTSMGTKKSPLIRAMSKD